MGEGRGQLDEARSGGIGSADPLAELTPLQTLVPIFEKIRAFAAANGDAITRDEAILEELSKLLHAKVFDEVEAERGRRLRFRADPEEPDQLIAHRIAALYEEASLESVSGIQKIRLDATTCAYAVRQLEPWRLTRAGRDVVGEAYESLIFPTLRGGQGQFFTPQNVARLMAALADPPAGARVIDPACGTGGFLIEVARLASGGCSELVGIDKDHLLARLAQDNLKLRFGIGEVACANSLVGPLDLPVAAASLLEAGTYDVVITNPPFGSRIPVTGPHLQLFDLAYQWRRNSRTGSWAKTEKVREAVPPQILFVERSVQLLREGGRCVIVLPEGIGGNASLGYVRQWLCERADLLAVIDCPLETFMPSTSTKTIIVVFERREIPSRPPVFMAVAEHCGHDRRGRPRTDESGAVLDDFPAITEAWREHEQHNLS